MTDAVQDAVPEVPTVADTLNTPDNADQNPSPSPDKDPTDPPTDKQDPPAKTVEVDTEYPQYDDPNATAVVTLLKEAGVTPKESYSAFADAVATGDFSKVNMEALTAKLGAEKANLALLGVKAYYDAQTTPVKESVAAVYDTVGGEGNWQKVAAWARSKADKDPAFKAQVDAYNQMFDLNKSAATLAAKELLAAYNSDGGNSSLVKTQVHGDRASGVGSGLEYISRADYNEQLRIAMVKNDMVQVAHLNARRQKSLNT